MNRHGGTSLGRQVFGALILFTLPFSGHVSASDVIRMHEITHLGQSSEIHISNPALSVGPDGTVYVAWVKDEDGQRNLRVWSGQSSEAEAIRVNPDSMSVASLHHRPSLAVSVIGEVLVAWAGVIRGNESSQPLLYLSRSTDKGKNFGAPVIVATEKVRSPSFEGITTDSQGNVLIGALSWSGATNDPALWLLKGSPAIGQWTGLLVDVAACPCCRVSLATSSTGSTAILWRKVFDGNIRDMVVSRFDNSASTVSAPHLVHADNWKLDACPHRGGQLAFNSNGEISILWYTEGSDQTPRILLSSGRGNSELTKPFRLNEDNGWIPDHSSLAINSAGRSGVIWQEATAARSRIVFCNPDKGREAPANTQNLTQTLKANAPAIAAANDSSFVVVWREDQWPTLKTVIARIVP